MEILAKRMKELRQEAKLSQMDAAVKLGLSLTGYCNYEHGTRDPGAETIVAIADLYHVSADYLLGRSDVR